jgi:hypothetical protein
MIQAIWFGRRAFTGGLRLQDSLYNAIISADRKKFVDSRYN